MYYLRILDHLPTYLLLRQNAARCNVPGRAKKKFKVLIPPKYIYLRSIAGQCSFFFQKFLPIISACPMCGQSLIKMPSPKSDDRLLFC